MEGEFRYRDQADKFEQDELDAEYRERQEKLPWPPRQRPLDDDEAFENVREEDCE